MQKRLANSSGATTERFTGIWLAERGATSRTISWPKCGFVPFEVVQNSIFTTLTPDPGYMELPVTS